MKRFVVTAGVLLHAFSDTPSKRFVELWFQGRWRLVFDRDTLIHYCMSLRGFGFQEWEVRAWAWNLRDRSRSDFVEVPAVTRGDSIAYPVERVAVEQAASVVFARQTEKAMGSDVADWLSVEDALEIVERGDL